MHITYLIPPLIANYVKVLMSSHNRNTTSTHANSKLGFPHSSTSDMPTPPKHTQLITYADITINTHVANMAAKVYSTHAQNTLLDQVRLTP